MQRQYLRTNEVGDLSPLCKLPPHALWRFCAESDQYYVEIVVDGKMVIASGRNPNPHQAVSEAISKWRDLPQEMREQ